ncbi:MAG: hypothetical protein AB4352_20865 [Hormoscilla sp.]
MASNVVKDPNFPMQHVKITDLKNTAKITEMVKESDLLIIRNGETVAYMLTPEHYEALIANTREACISAMETFLVNYHRSQANLHRLAEAMASFDARVNDARSHHHVRDD